MRLSPLIVAAVLFGCGAANAQSPMTSGGIGATSPLGVPGASAASESNSPTGIPLGATEIDPGGLSPAPLSNCNASGSANSGMSAGMTGSSASGMGSTPGMGSTFDGGGFNSTGSAAPASGCTSTTNPSPTGTAPPVSTPGTSSNFILNGGTIPLGSTEIDSGGVSPLITVPMTNGSTPSCAGATTSSSGAVTGPTLGTIPPGC